MDSETRESAAPFEAAEAKVALPDMRPVLVTLDDVKARRDVLALVRRADENLDAIGYTEHGSRHANLVANIAQNILVHLHADERSVQLAAIAGYLHDIGNVVNRNVHGETGAVLALQILLNLGMDVEEATIVAAAIGNHEEQTGDPVSAVSAAVIIADKSDVHRSRVRNQNPRDYDIHDRVNHAAVHSFVRVDAERKAIALELKIDEVEGAGVIDYFEIFLERMLASRRAAKFLGCRFELVINGNRML